MDAEEDGLDWNERGVSQLLTRVILDDRKTEIKHKY